MCSGVRIKMADEIRIRMAGPGDALELLEIYRPYVEHTAITFEYETPGIEEFQDRIAGTLARYPYLAACRGEEILGYAYASPFKERAAYDWAVETSLYIREDSRGRGLGRELYRKLEAVLLAQNVQNVNACIACTDSPDSRLDNRSVGFHEHVGYRTVGTFHRCGYKFGRWYDVVWMEKLLGGHPDSPGRVIPVGELGGRMKSLLA